MRQYGACVSHLDDGVGKILAALDRAGVRENTVVLFLSDNGGSTGTQNNDPQYAGTHPSFKIPARNGTLRGKKGHGVRGRHPHAGAHLLAGPAEAARRALAGPRRGLVPDLRRPSRATSRRTT